MTSDSMRTLLMIPGLVSTHYPIQSRPNHHRSHTLSRVFENSSVTLGSPPKFPKKQPIERHVEQPLWLQYHNRVLRFFAYFYEAIVDDSGEKLERMRRVVLCFFLCDNTISIFEPKSENSGCVQGAFMRRSKLHKANGEPYSPYDLLVGAVVEIYSRSFHIVDCDATTRAFYQDELDIAMPQALAFPPQPLEHNASSKPRISSRKASLEEQKAFHTFQDNFSKVLCFSVFWYDANVSYPELRKYTLRYFLENDTIQIVEPREERTITGRGHFPLLFSRQKMHSHARVKFPTSPSDDCVVLAKNLLCGRVIRLHSRDFLLADCDEFTRLYYAQTFGIQQKRFEKSIESALGKSDADSSKKDVWTTLFDTMSEKDRMDAAADPYKVNCAYGCGIDPTDNVFDKKQLRFLVKFHPNDAQDPIHRDRRFVLCFFMEDDTLALYEKSELNSGISGKLFLDRRRYKLLLPGKENERYVLLSDLYVGAVLRFAISPYQKFEIDKADERTLQYCEAHDDLFPFSNISRVLLSLSDSLVESYSDQAIRRLRAAFRDADVEKRGALSVQAMNDLFHGLGLNDRLNLQQRMTIVRRFSQAAEDHDSAQFQLVQYEELVDTLTCVLCFPAKNDGLRGILCGNPTLRYKFREMDSKVENRISIKDGMDVLERCKLASEEIVTSLGPHIKNGWFEYQNYCDAVFDIAPVD